MEAFILTFDVFCMVWICWKLIKIDENSAKHPDLGFLSYRKPAQE